MLHKFLVTRLWFKHADFCIIAQNWTQAYTIVDSLIDKWSDYNLQLLDAAPELAH